MRDQTRTLAGDTEGRLHLPAADRASRVEVITCLLGMFNALEEIRVARSRGISEDASHPLDFVPTHGEAFLMMVHLVETWIDVDPADMPASSVAQFAFMTLYPSIPEAMALQMAFGERVGLDHTREIARLVARATQRDMTVDEYVEALAAAEAVPRTKFLRLFHGEIRRKPDPERLGRGIALLRRIASLVPEEMRPPMLCAIAWLHWAAGKRAHAMAYITEAQQIEPEHILAYGLAWLITTKTPVWPSVTS